MVLGSIDGVSGREYEELSYNRLISSVAQKCV
jgi:hypothetical protein